MFAQAVGSKSPPAVVQLVAGEARRWVQFEIPAPVDFVPSSQSASETINPDRGIRCCDEICI